MHQIWLEVGLYAVATYLVAAGLWSWLLLRQPGPLTIEFSGKVITRLPLPTVRAICTVAMVIGFFVIKTMVV